MENKTVVAWDSSPSAEAALEWAIERERGRNGTIAIVRVLGEIDTDADFSATEREVAGEREGLDAAALRAQRAAPDCLVTATTIRGKPYDELLRFVRPDWVVAVGTQQRTAARFRYGGSMGARLAAVAQGPVAIIPEHVTANRSGIVVGVNGSSTSRAAVLVAAAEADERGEPLVLVHAWRGPSLLPGQPMRDPVILRLLEDESRHILAEAGENVRQNFPRVKAERRSLHGSPHEVLQRSAKTAVALVLGSRGLHGVRRVLLGSVSHGIVLDLATPTIIVGELAPVLDGVSEDKPRRS